MHEPETIQVDDPTREQYIVYAHCTDVYNFPQVPWSLNNTPMGNELKELLEEGVISRVVIFLSKIRPAHIQSV